MIFNQWIKDDDWTALSLMDTSVYTSSTVQLSSDAKVDTEEERLSHIQDGGVG